MSQQIINLLIVLLIPVFSMIFLFIGIRIGKNVVLYGGTSRTDWADASISRPNDDEDYNNYGEY